APRHQAAVVLHLVSPAYDAVLAVVSVEPVLRCNVDADVVLHPPNAFFHARFSLREPPHGYASYGTSSPGFTRAIQRLRHSSLRSGFTSSSSNPSERRRSRDESSPVA